MRKLLTITDLTRMKGGHVCIAGIDSDGVCVRPVLPPPGLFHEHLQVEGRTVIKPRAKIEFELRPTSCAAPHTEDMEFEAATWRHLGDCDDDEWFQLLDSDTAPSVEAIFQGALRDRRYVMPGQAAQSLGTVQAFDIHEMQFLDPHTGAPRPRLRFSDAAGAVYDLPITDLAWRDWIATLGTGASRSGHTAVVRAVQMLKKAPALFLRVGLTRPFDPEGGTQEKCWLQITGVYRMAHRATQKPEAQAQQPGKEGHNRELLLEQETSRVIAALNDRPTTWDEARAWQRQLEVLAKQLKEALEEAVLVSLPAGESLSTDAYKFEHIAATQMLRLYADAIKREFPPESRPDFYRKTSRRAYLRIGNPEMK